MNKSYELVKIYNESKICLRKKNRHDKSIISGFKAKHDFIDNFLLFIKIDLFINTTY